MTTLSQKERKRERNKSYRESEAGKAAYRRYQDSGKALASSRRYRATDHGKLVDKARSQRYWRENRTKVLARPDIVERWANDLAEMVEQREAGPTYMERGCPLGSWKK